MRKKINREKLDQVKLKREVMKNKITTVKIYRSCHEIMKIMIDDTRGEKRTKGRQRYRMDSAWLLRQKKK